MGGPACAREEENRLKIQESAENYLEAILILKGQNGKVRSIDIVIYFDFTKSSIIMVIGLFKSNGYVSVDKDGFIELTESGLAIAEKMYERHLFISRWLEHIGVDAETAARDACRIEHVISDETFDKIREFLTGGEDFEEKR